MAEEVMRDPEAARAAGLWMTGEDVCMNCHKQKGTHVAVLGSPKFDVQEAMNVLRSRKYSRASVFDHDGILGGHPEAAKIPGVEASTGALGHGPSVALGMALAARLRGQNHRVFAVTGDGEINEGSVWEAAMTAGKHGLDIRRGLFLLPYFFRITVQFGIN